MLNWIPPELAPKDGTQILAYFETYPFPVMAVWCGASGAWCAAVPQVDMNQGELNDWYFENEHFPAEQLKVWGNVRHNAKAVGLDAAGGQSRTSDGLCPGASSEN